MGGFAIGARVALLWQHNANPCYKLASIPRYDDIVRTAGWAGSARAAGRRPAGDEGAPKTARRIREAGAPARRRPAADGAFSTSMRQSGLRASNGGVLATKNERKMLASTCLYLLYAWFNFEAASLFYVRRAIVTDRVAWSLGRSVTIVSPTKTAEPIEMPSGL